MREIRRIVRALGSIDGTLIEFPPAEGPSGSDPARSDPRKKLWRGIGAGNDRHDEGALSTPLDVNDSWLDDDRAGMAFDFDPKFQLTPTAEDGLPTLGADQRVKIAQDVLLRGVDALGWYSSFHVTGVQWGAYVKLSSLLYLACEAFSELDLQPVAKLRLAFRAILDHELFHFATDYAIAQTELAQGSAWWVPYNKACSQTTSPPYPIEEKLANAYILRRFRSGPRALRVRGGQPAMRRFTQQQPEGYRDAYQVQPRDWAGELTKLAREYAGRWAADHDSEGLFGGAYDWEAQFPIWPAVDWRFCPIHLVDDSRRYGLPEEWLDAFARLERVVESDAFRKQLARLSVQLQGAWQRVKRKLETGITSGCDFKRWSPGGPDTWSCRVNGNFRAHLREDKIGGRWEAVAIGGHKALGHG